jgi:chemotaxis protein MotB
MGMRLGIIIASALAIVFLAIAIGLKLQNSNQKDFLERYKLALHACQKMGKETEDELKTIKMIESQLQSATGDLLQRNAALEGEIAKQITLIESMRKQLPGATQLPAGLISLLEAWARGSDLATFDPNRGVVKFKSSSLFKGGSDVIEPNAAEAVKSLCKILNTDQAKEFDIIIAGHTDNQPIFNPGTLAKHPTNLHLSVHRAISVFNVMASDGIAPERMNVRGFGEYRPIVPNEPNMMTGTPQNRRIEINIVPRGV